MSADGPVPQTFRSSPLAVSISPITKPYARVRTGSVPTLPVQTFVLENLRVDLAKRQVFLNDREVHLTPIEYRLLVLLIKHAGKVVTHRQLLKEVWGPAHVTQTQYLRVYMTQLRHKLEADPARPRFFLNEPGIGYRLRFDVEQGSTPVQEVESRTGGGPLPGSGGFSSLRPWWIYFQTTPR